MLSSNKIELNNNSHEQSHTPVDASAERSNTPATFIALGLLAVAALYTITTHSAKAVEANIEQTVIQLGGSGFTIGHEPNPSGAKHEVAKPAPPAVQPTDVPPIYLSYVDTARNRTLPVNVYLPREPGPHPLVELAKGRFAHATDYLRFIGKITNAGYVVAAIGFPENNLTDQPAVKAWPSKAVDLSYVQTALSKDVKVASFIDFKEVALIGHSDGSPEVLLAACNPVLKDSRVAAVISMDGAYPGGEKISECVPNVLFIHGTDDKIQNMSGSINAFQELSAVNKYLVKIEAADHFHYIWEDKGVTTAASDMTVLSFLDQTLKTKGNFKDIVNSLGAAVEMKSNK